MRRGRPAIMALGASTTRKQLQKAICTDRRAGATGEMLYDSVEYQVAANTWSRAVVHPVLRRLIADKYC